MPRDLKLWSHADLSWRFVLQRHCEEHEQKKSALRGMLHTPIYLAMTKSVCVTVALLINLIIFYIYVQGPSRPRGLGSILVHWPLQKFQYK